MNYAKNRGTLAETALCDYLADMTGLEVMRRTMHGGGNDRGDLRIVGFPLMAEVKNTKGVRLPRWYDETTRQMVNASCDYGVLIWSPFGLGVRSIDRWVAIEWADTAMTPFGCAGGVYTGPANGLAAAIRGSAIVQHEGLPLFIGKDDNPRWARLRLLRDWVPDLQETIATRARLAR